ncbi:hypothetical protein Tco_0888823, partial [Tanacetum coccineum]
VAVVRVVTAEVRCSVVGGVGCRRWLDVAGGGVCGCEGRGDSGGAAVEGRL